MNEREETLPCGVLIDDPLPRLSQAFVVAELHAENRRLREALAEAESKLRSIGLSAPVGG